jgi:hypothetical protein
LLLPLCFAFRSFQHLIVPLGRRAQGLLEHRFPDALDLGDTSV